MGLPQVQRGSRHAGIYHGLFTTDDVHALRGGLALESAPVKGVPHVCLIRAIRAICGCYFRYIVWYLGIALEGDVWGLTTKAVKRAFVDGELVGGR